MAKQDADARYNNALETLTLIASLALPLAGLLSLPFHLYTTWYAFQQHAAAGIFTLFLPGLAEVVWYILAPPGSHYAIVCYLWFALLLTGVASPALLRFKRTIDPTPTPTSSPTTKSDDTPTSDPETEPQPTNPETPKHHITSAIPPTVVLLVGLFWGFIVTWRACLLPETIPTCLFILLFATLPCTVYALYAYQQIGKGTPIKSDNKTPLIGLLAMYFVLGLVLYGIITLLLDSHTKTPDEFPTKVSATATPIKGFDPEAYLADTRPTLPSLPKLPELPKMPEPPSLPQLPPIPASAAIPELPPIPEPTQEESVAKFRSFIREIEAQTGRRNVEATVTSWEFDDWLENQDTETKDQASEDSVQSASAVLDKYDRDMAAMHKPPPEPSPEQRHAAFIREVVAQTKHRDAATIVEHPVFLTWLTHQSPAIQRMYNSNDIIDMDLVLSRYKREMNKDKVQTEESIESLIEEYRQNAKVEP